MKPTGRRVGAAILRLSEHHDLGRGLIQAGLLLALALLALVIAGWPGFAHAALDLREHRQAENRERDSGGDWEQVNAAPVPADDEVKLPALGIYGSDEPSVTSETRFGSPVTVGAFFGPPHSNPE